MGTTNVSCSPESFPERVGNVNWLDSNKRKSVEWQTKKAANCRLIGMEPSRLGRLHQGGEDDVVRSIDLFVDPRQLLDNQGNTIHQYFGTPLWASSTCLSCITPSADLVL